jgi:diguanylate cyclase (GGDEF)-like protein
VLVADAHADPRFASRFEKMTGHATKSIVAVPMRSKGKILGVIELVNSGDGRAFSADDLRTLATIADYAAIAIENAKTLERLRELTLVDDHTGLYNTRHLYRQLEAEILRSRRFGHKLSILFFDLDHFKVVNDTHGHQAGSGLLKEIGEVLLETLRTVDIPTRYGGDEFVCLLPETDRDQAVRCAQRVRKAINDRVFLAGRGLSVRITASFGIATFPDDGQTEEDLLRLADGAMYRVKESTRDAIMSAAPAPVVAAPVP